MLQTVDEKRLKEIQEILNQLDIRFPNSEIVKRTGFDKGFVSAILNGKKPITDNFYSSFLDKFPVDENYMSKRRRMKNEKSNDTLLYYEVGAKAGSAEGAEILPVKKSEGVLHIGDLFKGSQFAIRISGNSMTPNYPSGAIIGIREIYDKQITPGSVYVIEKNSDLWIKRLFYKDDNQDSGYFQCISDNTMKYDGGQRDGKYYYPAFYIPIDAVTRLFKVTGIYKANELTVIN